VIAPVTHGRRELGVEAELRDEGPGAERDGDAEVNLAHVIARFAVVGAARCNADATSTAAAAEWSRLIHVERTAIG